MTSSAIEFSGLKAQAERLPGLERALARVLDHGQFIGGPEIGELETELARRAGVAHAITCSSGTDALLMALMGLGIGLGDAVLVPTFTFPATGEVVALLGASPVFVDVDLASFNLDPRKVVEAIGAAEATGLRPRALIAVDLYGRPAAYSELLSISREHHLSVIADAAQSFGAWQDGSPVGSLASVTATSFFPAKPLGCFGDGGSLFTDDPATADIFRSIRSHGRGVGKYDIVRPGLNARLDTLQAAVLLEKLTLFDEEMALRRAVAARYHDLLADSVICPPSDGDSLSAWAQYTVRVQARDEVVAALEAEAVPTAVYYPRPLHAQPAYATYRLEGQEFPAADQLAREVLSLPMHPYLEISEQDRVAEALRAAAGKVLATESGEHGM